MNHFRLPTGAALLLVMAPLSAQQPEAWGPDRNVAYGYADVLRVDPVYELVRYTEPREECENVRVVRRERDGGDPTAGTVIGAIVGAAVGNQVGRGDGRRAATVAGAIAGGAIGRNVDRNNGPVVESDGVERRCHVVEVERTERRIAGYDVEYRYKGENYFSRLSYDPGNKLRVRIAVEPAE